ITFSPGKRSSVPSKIRCESAIVVSSGLPMVLPSQPLPASRLLASGTPCGWMNSGTPSSSALAHTGWNLGSENSMPATWPPIAAPFRPCFLTAVSSSWTARSGACRVSEAKAAKRSGLEAQSSASFSFWIFTIWVARSRSLPYQKGLIDSTSMSTACASIAFNRLSISMKASWASRTGGSWSDAASAPKSAPASRKWQCAWTSMVLTFLPLTAMGRVRMPACACARSTRPQLQKTIPVAAAVPPLRKFRRVVIAASLPGLDRCFFRRIASLARPGRLRNGCNRVVTAALRSARGGKSRRDAALAAAEAPVPAIADIAAGRVIEIIEALQEHPAGVHEHATVAHDLDPLRPQRVAAFADTEGVGGGLRVAPVGQVDGDLRAGRRARAGFERRAGGRRQEHVVDAGIHQDRAVARNAVDRYRHRRRVPLRRIRPRCRAGRELHEGEVVGEL